MVRSPMSMRVGDAVIALFGLPDARPGYAAAAVECARAISQIGDSVSNEWQRQIDRMQTAGGVHIGMSIGSLQLLSLRPYGRAHMGCVGDSINMAARLMNADLNAPGAPRPAIGHNAELLAAE